MHARRHLYIVYPLRCDDNPYHYYYFMCVFFWAIIATNTVQFVYVMWSLDADRIHSHKIYLRASLWATNHMSSSIVTSSGRKWATRSPDGRCGLKWMSLSATVSLQINYCDTSSSAYHNSHDRGDLVFRWLLLLSRILTELQCAQQYNSR